MSIAISEKDRKDFKKFLTSGIAALGLFALGDMIGNSMEKSKRDDIEQSNASIPVVYNQFYRSHVATLDAQKLAEFKSFKDEQNKVFVRCVSSDLNEKSMALLRDGKIRAAESGVPLDADKIAHCMKTEFAKAIEHKHDKSNGGLSLILLAAFVFAAGRSVANGVPAMYRVGHQIAGSMRKKPSDGPAPS